MNKLKTNSLICEHHLEYLLNERGDMLTYRQYHCRRSDVETDIPRYQSKHPLRCQCEYLSIMHMIIERYKSHKKKSMQSNAQKQIAAL